MMYRLFALCAAGLVAAASLAGCAPMTPQQTQAVELRRFCESNPSDMTRCLGFLGEI